MKFVVGACEKIKYIPVSVKAMKKASPICKQPPQDMSIIFTPFKVETMAGMFSVDLCKKQYLNPLTSLQKITLKSHRNVLAVSM